MKIFIVEDEKIHLEDLLITIEELGHQCIGYSDDPMEALEKIEKLQPDVVIQDIQLNGKISGIQLADKIKKLYGIPIIFATSHKDDPIMIAALETNPVTYLVKPIQNGDLKAALLMAQKIQSEDGKAGELEESADGFVFIKVGNKLQKVIINTILFIQTDEKNYCTIVTSDEKKYAVRSSIQAILKILPLNDFIQIHRSYAVNIQFIESFIETDQTIVLKKHNLPVGRTFKDSFYKRVKLL